MRRALTAVAAVLSLAGCDANVTHWSLPGGTATGSGYTITAVFADVGALTARGQVRSRGVAVGDVTSVSLQEDNTALVAMKLKKNVQVPVGTQAVLATASLLGSTYVDLVPPRSPQPQAFLKPGDQIGEGATGGVPDVEQVLAAMSAVLNGSGLAQLDTIITELDKALTPRTGTVRDLVGQLRSLVGTLDGSKASILGLVDALHQLSGQLVANTRMLDTALTDLAPGLATLSAGTDEFTALLQRLSSLGTTAKRVVGEIQADTVASLRLLDPLTVTLESVKGDLAHTVDRIALAAADLQKAIPGDFINLKVRLVAGSPLTAASHRNAEARP